MLKHLKNPRSWVIISFLLGFMLSMTGWVWWELQTPQTQWYNRGVIAYNTGNYDLAVNNFDKSIAEFAKDPNTKGAFTAPNSVEMAALAQFQKFKALLKMKNGKLAVIAIKEALKLSTDLNLAKYKLSDTQLQKIKEDRIVFQTDLEILFHQQKDLQEQEGKGKGNKPGQPGDKPADDPSKGSGSGKTPRDAL